MKNVKVENLPGYFTAKGDITKTAEELTLADVQKLVDDVNAKAVDTETEAEIVEAVQDALDAGNQVALLQALNNDAFVRVNSKWISTPTNGYINTIGASDDSIAKIQSKINTSNDTILKAPGTLTTTGIDRTKLADSQELINAYATVDKEGKITDSTIKTYPTLIKTQIAVADVVEATTPTALKNKLSALATLVDNPSILDMKNYVDANGKAYVDALKAKAAADKDEVSEVEAILFGAGTGVNDVEAAKLVTAVQDAAKATPVDADKLLKALNDLGLKQVAASNKDAYALEADFKTATPKSAVQTAVDKVNLAVVKAEKTDADKLLIALKVLELKNVVDANKDAYLADNKLAMGSTIQGAANATALDNALKAINQAETDKAEVKAINAATTATEVKTALDKLAIADYVNVPSADKLYVAEKVLKARDSETDKEFASKARLTTVLGTTSTSGLLKDYADLIGEYNYSALTDIATTVAQLDKLGYAAFDDLSAGQKADVAEAFVANYPQDKDGNAVNYTTLAAVKAGVDAAITAVAE